MSCKKFQTVVWAGGLTLVLAIAAGVANADVVGTYVDATLSNTELVSDIVATGAENDADNLWYHRAQSGAEGDTIIVSQGNAEDSPMLTTTVSGVENGLYNVYVVYWTHTAGNRDWNVQAAVAGSTPATYNKTNGTLTGSAFGDIGQRQALIGQVNVTDGAFSVNIDDWAGPRPGVSDYRTWYDGISYMAVPEPSSIALVLTGLAGLLAYAWKRRR